MIKAHKIRLNPTKEQEQYFWKATGVARFAFNWGLAEYNRRKTEGQKVKIIGKGATLKQEFTALKASQFLWLGDVSSYAYQGAFSDLQKAISNYFERKKKGLLKPSPDYKSRKDGKPYGWPRFRSKNNETPCFYQANTCLRFNGHLVRIEKCPGLVNMTEPLRFNGKVMGARISHHANHWWLSVQVEVDQEIPEHNTDAVGIDLGIKYLAVTSDGQVFENPKALQMVERKLRRLQRHLDRQSKKNDKGEMLPAREQGKNWHKTQQQIAKLHYRVANIRKEASHQMTTELTRQYGIIGIEDLNLRGMVKNRQLSKALSDAALYEKRRQLEYKTAWNGGTVVAVGRWFPSSKLCNGCGEINAELKLSDREWTCSNCGKLNHRDGNASQNIRDEAIRILAGTSPDYSDGDDKNALALTLSNGGVVKENVNLEGDLPHECGLRAFLVRIAITRDSQEKLAAWHLHFVKRNLFEEKP